MKRAITLKDIAHKLNMSVSTVSKALSNDTSISALTSERVKKLALEWNYVPNEAARHFKLNKTLTIGLIIPSLLDQFYVLAVNGTEKVASVEKYNVIITQSHEDPSNEKTIVDLMKRNRVDGVIVSITKNTQDMSPFRELENTGIPVVFFSRVPKDESFDYVIADNAGGAFKATEFLIKKGHQRIAHLMGPESMAVSYIRLEGYKDALAHHHLTFDPTLVQSVDFTEASTFSAMHKLMALQDPPTALFAFKNYIALEGIEYLKKSAPEKLSSVAFVGFGNLPLIQYLDHKPVASIEESAYEMGEAAAQLLFKIIKEDTPEKIRIAQHQQIECKLLEH